jgi:hypothetical protein
MTAEAFHDPLAPFYHLIFPDWEASIALLPALFGRIGWPNSHRPAACVFLIRVL